MMAAVLGTTSSFAVTQCQSLRSNSQRTSLQSCGASILRPYNGGCLYRWSSSREPRPERRVAPRNTLTISSFPSPTSRLAPSSTSFSSASSSTSSLPSASLRRAKHCQGRKCRKQSLVAVCSATGEKASPSSPDLDGPMLATFEASKSFCMEVAEAGKPLAEYMALPASQYSVLDAKRIERIDDNSFRCYVGGINFIAFTVQPVLTVRVDEEEKGCTIRLLSAKLEGSPIVQAQNDKFSATMENRVSYEDKEGSPNVKLITSNTHLQVVVQVPKAFHFLGADSISKTGCKVMEGVLSQMVPRFTKQLKTDYALWASGDSSRKPVGSLMED